MSEHNIIYKINAIDNLTGVYRKIIGFNSKAKTGVTNLNKKLTGTGTVLGKVKRGFNKLEKTALKVPKKIMGGFNKLRNKLGNFASFLGVAFSVNVVKDFIGDIIGRASDLNETLGKSKIVFGRYFGDIEKFAGEAWKTIGMSKEEALSAASSFGGMFQNIGIGRTEIAKMSKDAVKLVADLGSFENMGTEEALSSLMSGLRGETEPLQKFNVVLDDARLKQKAYDMGLIKTIKGSLPKAIRAQAIYASVLEQTKNAQGNFAATSQDLANAQKILTAGWNNLKVKLGTHLVPEMTRIVNKSIIIVDWIDKNSAAIGKWVGWIGKATAATAVFWGGGKLILNWSKYMTAIKGVVGAWKLLIGKLKIGKIVMFAFNLVAKAGPFGWIAMAIGGVILLAKNWDWFGSKLSGLFDWVKKIGIWIIKNHPFMWMINLIDKVFPGFKDKLSGLFKDVIAFFKKAYNWIFDNFLGPIGDALSWLGKQLGFGDSAFTVKHTADEFNLPGSSDDSKFKGYGDLASVFSKNGSKGSNPIKKAKDDLVSGGRGAIKNNYITIDKLVEKLIFNTTNLEENKAKIKTEIERVLLTVVNDVNYQ